MDHAALHDQAELVQVLEDAEVLEGVPGDRDEVGVLARFHGADLAFPAEELGVDAGGGEQGRGNAVDLSQPPVLALGQGWKTGFC